MEQMYKSLESSLWLFHGSLSAPSENKHLYTLVHTVHTDELVHTVYGRAKLFGFQQESGRNRFL